MAQSGIQIGRSASTRLDRSFVILSEAKDLGHGVKVAVDDIGGSSPWARCFTTLRSVQHDKTTGRTGRCFTLGMCLLALLGGCASQPQRLTICPGKATVDEALQTLSARAQNAVPVWANGQAVLTYHVPNRKKPERHALDIVLRFDPPMRIYIQGNVTAVGKAVIIGSNEEKFWLALRPKEISSYYLGRWEDVRDFDGLVMSPRVVLEAVGLVIEPGAEPNAASWTLENKGPYDILTRRDEAGRVVKRVHVYACDYSVHKIEYFDHGGKIVAVAQLDNYKPVVEGFQVPTRIDIVSTRPDGRKDSIVMDISSPKTKPFTEQQRQFLFSPPDAGKFEHVYHYENGQWVPEQ